MSRDGLIAEFQGFVSPRERWRVGLEIERHLLRPDGTPVPYEGEFGVRWLIERLAPNGWKPKYEGENMIALFRADGASVTLEPGSQWEYSSAPQADVRTLDAECRAFVRETDEGIGDAPITPVALGYTPFADVEKIPWVPKGRYVVMREHLGATGDLAHHMMKATCATQASFDFSDEADCARKVGVGMLTAPLTTAMFANSPVSQGKPNGWQSFRGHVWTRTDPLRAGFPDAARSFSFAKWVDYLLDVPMMFLYDDEHGWRPARGASFRRWMDEGIDGKYPDSADWELHLTSVFPEVRVKRFIEIRGADCVAHPLAIAFGAYFESILYDDRARDAAFAIGEEFASHGTTAERFDVACRSGLGGVVGGRSLASWASALVDAADQGLSRWRPNDRALMKPLVDQVASGESPAAEVLRSLARDPSPVAFAAAHRYSA